MPVYFIRTAVYIHRQNILDVVLHNESKDVLDFRNVAEWNESIMTIAFYPENKIYYSKISDFRSTYNRRVFTQQIIEKYFGFVKRCKDCW